MLCQLSSRGLSLMCVTALSPYIGVSFIPCMRTALRVRRLIRSRHVWLVMLSVNITRMVIVLFMMRLYAWRRISLCAYRYWTGRVTLAQLTVIRQPLCVIPKSVWTAPRRRFWLISKRTQSISKKTMMPLKQSLWFYLRASPIFSSMGPAVLLWVWQRILRRITSGKLSMQRLL